MTTEQDTYETPVIFRIPRSKRLAENDGVTAYFPTIPSDYQGFYITCYAHVGQHCGASLEHLNNPRTRPATPAEYADLKSELESLGYKLRVYKRQQRWMDKERFAEIRNGRG